MLCQPFSERGRSTFQQSSLAHARTHTRALSPGVSLHQPWHALGLPLCSGGSSETSQVTASPQSTQGHTGQETAALSGPTPNKTKQHSETCLHEELEPVSSAFLLFFHSHIQANLQTRWCKPKGQHTVLTTPAAGQRRRGWTGVAAGVGAVSALWTLCPTPPTPASPAFKGVPNIFSCSSFPLEV